MATTGPGATGVSLKGDQTVAQFKAPYKGILRDVNFAELPPDALYDSLNVLYRAGGLIARPGLKQLDPTDLGSRVTGAYGAILAQSISSAAFQPDSFQNDTFQIGSGGLNAAAFMASTLSKLWAYYSNAWHDLTGTPLIGAIGNQGRFTLIQSGGLPNVLFTDGLSVPQIWSTTTPTFTNIAGFPPKFSDWTTASSRIIGLLPPYTIQWNPAFVIDSWPANQFIMSDTPDPLVAIRNLGTLNVAVYKTDSIWVGTAQGGPDASYFSFQLRGAFEGPCNPACVVDVDGTHYYFTNSGRVGVFDGTRFTWINDAILPAIRQVLNSNLSPALAHGAYDAFNREVWFSFPTNEDGDAGDVTGLLTIILPKPYSYEGLTFHSAYLGKWAFPVVMSTDRRFGPLHDLLLFGQPNSMQNFSYSLALNSLDGATTFPGFWKTGVQMSPRGNIYRAIGVECYATRGQGYAPLTQRILYSDVEGTDGAIEGPPITIPLSDVPEPVHAKRAGSTQGRSATPAARGRFFGVRFDFQAPMQSRYTGARIFGTDVE